MNEVKVELDAEWEKFEGGPARTFKERIHVTLNERGGIYINSNLFNQMGRPAAVLLYYNSEREQIAIVPASAQRPEAFPVREKKNGAHWIYAWPFCRHYNIRFAASHKFLKPILNEDRSVILDLRNTTPVFHKSKFRKAKPPPPRVHRPVVDEMLAEWEQEDQEQDALSKE